MVSNDRSIYFHCSSVNLLIGDQIVALGLVDTWLVVTPSLLYKPPVTNLPLTTPIDPVLVDGLAIIFSAFIATKYPPDPATAPIVTITGFPAFFARTVSLQIISEPI